MSQNLVIPESSTPVWILRARQSVDRGILLAFVFGLMSVWAILTSSQVPAGTQLEHVLFRTADTAAALREGRIYPRWSPHLLNGYGAPLPSFTPPAAHYAAGTLTVMLTDDPVMSVRILFAVTQLTACAALYAWTTRRSGALAGCVAAAFYAFAPVISWSVNQLQGDLSLLIAIAGSVTLLWAVDRTLIDHLRSDALLIAGSTGLILLADPSIMLAILPTVALYTVFMFKGEAGFINRLTVLIGIAIGGLSSAFFWLPALLERHEVNWHLSPIEVSHMPTTLTSLLQPMIDGTSTQVVHAPGASVIFCAAAVVVLAAYHRRMSRFQAIFLVMAGVYGAAANTSTNNDLHWHALLTICLIVLGNTLVKYPDTVTNSFRLAALLIAITIILNAPILQGPNFSVSTNFDPSPLSSINFQLENYGYPGIPPGDHLPASIQPPSRMNFNLGAGYRSGSVNRLYFNSLRNQSVLLESNSHSHRYQVRLFVPDAADILVANFPGWEVYLNSLPLPVSENELNGTINTRIPAISDGIITVIFGITPARLLGWLVSLSGILIAGAYIAVRMRYTIGKSAFLIRDLLTVSETQVLFTVTMISGVIGMIIITLPQQTAPLDQLLNIRTSSGLILSDVAVSQAAASAGDTVHIESTWTPLISPDINYQVRVQVINESNGALMHQTDTITPAGLAVKRWVEARPITDHLYVTIPHDLPPGRYYLRLQLLPCNIRCEPEQAVIFYTPNNTTHYALPVRITVAGR